MLLILSRFSVTCSLVGSKNKTYKLQVFRSFGRIYKLISLHHSTRSVGGNLFDILRNQAFSLRQRLFWGKILRSSRRKSSEQFWSPVWTAGHSSAVDKMTQMCLSVPIRVSCGPFARVIRDRCGSFGKVNAHVKCRLCLLLLFLNGPLSGGGDFKDCVHYHRCLCHYGKLIPCVILSSW